MMAGNIGCLSYGQITDETHIRDSLQKLGCSVYENTSDPEVLKDIDLILTFKSNKVGVNQIKDWKSKTEAPIFIWTFDNCDRFKWIYDTIKECNLWLGEELGRRERFYQEGLPFYYFPFHADNPRYFFKVQYQKEYEVIFTGTPYQDDENSKFDILRAVQDKFDLHIFGNNPDGWKNQGFKNVHEPAFDKDLSFTVSKSKIILSISNSRLEGYWSIRASQVLLCGGFCLQRYSPQMEKELKDCVIYWNEKEDLLEKIRYYLQNDKEREEIAYKGFEYAKHWLTSDQRCKELLILLENYEQIKKAIKI